MKANTRPAPRASHPDKIKTVTCRHWKRGHCELGDRCNFRHDDGVKNQEVPRGHIPLPILDNDIPRHVSPGFLMSSNSSTPDVKARHPDMNYPQLFEMQYPQIPRLHPELLYGVNQYDFHHSMPNIKKYSNVAYDPRNFAGDLPNAYFRSENCAMPHNDAVIDFCRPVMSRPPNYPQYKDVQRDDRSESAAKSRIDRGVSPTIVDPFSWASSQYLRPNVYSNLLQMNRQPKIPEPMQPCWIPENVARLSSPQSFGDYIQSSSEKLPTVDRSSSDLSSSCSPTNFDDLQLEDNRSKTDSNLCAIPSTIAMLNSNGDALQQVDVQPTVPNNGIASL